MEDRSVKYQGHTMYMWGWEISGPIIVCRGLRSYPQCLCTINQNQMIWKWSRNCTFTKHLRLRWGEVMARWRKLNMETKATQTADSTYQCMKQHSSTKEGKTQTLNRVSKYGNTRQVCTNKEGSRADSEERISKKCDWGCPLVVWGELSMTFAK